MSELLEQAAVMCPIATALFLALAAYPAMAEKDDDHADEESTHSDVEAVWAFHCDKPAAIETVM